MVLHGANNSLHSDQLIGLNVLPFARCASESTRLPPAQQVSFDLAPQGFDAKTARTLLIERELTLAFVPGAVFRLHRCSFEMIAGWLSVDGGMLCGDGSGPRLSISAPLRYNQELPAELPWR